MQAFHRVSDLLVSGTDAVLRSLQGYAGRAWLLAAWQDVYVDRVQGQLQHLFLSLLARVAPLAQPPPIRLFICMSSAWSLCADSALERSVVPQTQRTLMAYFCCHHNCICESEEGTTLYKQSSLLGY